jgi:hypothetical protein
VTLVGVHRSYLGAEAPVDGRVPIYAPDEVRGHSLPEPLTADEHVDPCAGLGQVHGRLPGRGATAHDDHIFAAALCCLAAASPVVDTSSKHLLHHGDLEAPPDHSGSGERHLGGDLVAALDLEAEALVRLDAASGYAAQEDQLENCSA